MRRLALILVAAVLATSAVLLSFAVLAPSGERDGVRPVTVQTPSEAPQDADATRPVVTVAEPPVKIDRPTTWRIADPEPLGWPESTSDGLTPSDFTHVFELVAPEHGYPATPGFMRLLAAHARSAGHPEAPGNTFVRFAIGDRVEAVGSSWTVTEHWTAPKSAYAAQPHITHPEQYAGALIIATCLPRDQGRAVENVWTVLRPLT